MNVKLKVMKNPKKGKKKQAQIAHEATWALRSKISFNEKFNGKERFGRAGLLFCLLN
jgi:hypothetical protein